ncbi:MAG: hypothetical protein ACYDHP_00585 [Ferrimicrobium sp.]
MRLWWVGELRQGPSWSSKRQAWPGALAQGLLADLGAERAAARVRGTSVRLEQLGQLDPSQLQALRALHLSGAIKSMLEGMS